MNAVVDFLAFVVCVSAITINSWLVLKALEIQRQVALSQVVTPAGLTISGVDGDVNVDGDVAGRDIEKAVAK